MDDARRRQDVWFAACNSCCQELRLGPGWWHSGGQDLCRDCFGQLSLAEAADFTVVADFGKLGDAEANFRKVEFPSRLRPVLSANADEVVVTIRRALPCEWAYFRGHHYKDHKLAGAATCFTATLFGNQTPVAFTAVMDNGVNIFAKWMGNPLWRQWMKTAIPKEYTQREMYREHRTVVLPPYQGMGLGSLIADSVAHLCDKIGYAFVSMTVHPHYAAYRERSPFWVTCPRQVKLAGKLHMHSHAWVGARGKPELEARLAARVRLDPSMF